MKRWKRSFHRQARYVSFFRVRSRNRLPSIFGAFTHTIFTRNASTSYRIARQISA